MKRTLHTSLVLPQKTTQLKKTCLPISGKAKLGASFVDNTHFICATFLRKNGISPLPEGQNSLHPERIHLDPMVRIS